MISFASGGKKKDAKWFDPARAVLANAWGGRPTDWANLARLKLYFVTYLSAAKGIINVFSARGQHLNSCESCLTIVAHPCD